MLLANNTPTVAVWMVTYNHEAYIEQAIESVMMQETDFDFKLFIGEDCSTDGTRDICIELQNKYPERIELILNTTNLGSTLNAFQIYEACFQSGAPYMALLEGDDYWTDPLKLQKQVAFLEANPSYTFSFTRFLSGTSEDTLTDENAHFFKDNSNLVYDFDMFTKGWYGGTLTLLFRASCLNMAIIKTYRYFRDIHLYTILLKEGNGICMNFTSAVYRIHEYGHHNSLSKLEQFRHAIACYNELYQQHNIPALEKKHQYFINAYIYELIRLRQYGTAVMQIFWYGYKIKDLKFVSKYMKKLIKSLVRPYLKRKKGVKPFIGSANYWEERYRSNKTSGSGSYGRLANFKAEVLNDFVNLHAIQNVIEFGCGDGNQLQLANYPKYIGFDVSETALKLCRSQFESDSTKEFYSAFDKNYFSLQADLVLSLDVIYHLIEDAVYEAYMERLFNTASHYVIIYSSNYNEYKVAHVKCRKFTDWIKQHVSDSWRLEKIIKNPYPYDASNPDHTSMADFYIYKKL